MKNKKKSVEWLVVFIILIIMFTVAGTYAFLNIQDYYEGTFEVEIRAKGIDVFTFEDAQDVEINVTGYNFSQEFGHDVSGTAIINPTIETSNEKAKVCYQMDVNIPDSEVFDYSNGTVPELVLDVLYSEDNKTFTPLIDKMDITMATGKVDIPTTKDGDEYKFEIETTRNKKKKVYFKATITFVFFKDVDQSINDEKSYSASFNANVVEC